MKWKLLAVAVLVVSATYVGVTLLAQEIKNPSRKPVANTTYPDPISAQGVNRPKKVVREVAFEDNDALASLREEQTLKDRFLKLASNYAESGDEAELQRMANDLQKKIAERDARGKVQEIEQLLKYVVKQYPETEGAKRAKAMLDAGASVSTAPSAPAAEKK